MSATFPKPEVVNYDHWTSMWFIFKDKDQDPIDCCIITTQRIYLSSLTISQEDKVYTSLKDNANICN